MIAKEMAIGNINRCVCIVAAVAAGYCHHCESMDQLYGGQSTSPLINENAIVNPRFWASC